MAVATIATSSETRAPYTTRLKTSRPRGSTPKMLCELGPVGVPNESRYLPDWSFGGRAPTSFTTSGANTATSTRRTMNAAAASATRSVPRRRQKSCSGDRAAIAG